MLDMGFADDLEKILSALPLNRQTALFSATIAGPIARMAEAHLRQPARVRVQSEKAAEGEPARVRQVAYVVRRADKLAALGRILDLEDGAATLVFARTRGEVDDLAEALSGRGRDAAALHGGLSQEQRDKIMGRFREGPWTSSWRPTWRPVASTSSTSPTSSTTTCPPRRTRTFTASGGPGAPDARAWRSPWSSRASTGCCGTSSGRSGNRSRSPACRRCPTCASSGWTCSEVAPGGARRGWLRPLPGRGGGALGRVRSRGHRARGGQPGRCRGPRRRGHDRARAGDAAKLRPTGPAPDPRRGNPTALWRAVRRLRAAAPSGPPATSRRLTAPGWRAASPGVPGRGGSRAPHGSRRVVPRVTPPVPARRAAPCPQVRARATAQWLARRRRPSRDAPAARRLRRWRGHPCVRRGRSCGRHAPGRSGRRDHERGRAARRRHRRDPDRRRVGWSRCPRERRTT